MARSRVVVHRRTEGPEGGSESETTTTRDVNGGGGFPTKVNISGSAKGGTVLLITGTLFLGYLYFTRRLPNVLQAIARMPIPGSVMQQTPMGMVPYSPAQVVPISPSQNTAGYPRTIMLSFPVPYAAPPVTIVAADPATCAFEVEATTLQATGSLTLAQTYV